MLTAFGDPVNSANGYPHLMNASTNRLDPRGLEKAFGEAMRQSSTWPLRKGSNTCEISGM